MDDFKTHTHTHIIQWSIVLASLVLRPVQVDLGTIEAKLLHSKTIQPLRLSDKRMKGFVGAQ